MSNNAANSKTISGDEYVEHVHMAVAHMRHINNACLHTLIRELFHNEERMLEMCFSVNLELPTKQDV